MASCPRKKRKLRSKLRRCKREGTIAKMYTNPLPPHSVYLVVLYVRSCTTEGVEGGGAHKYPYSFRQGEEHVYLHSRKRPEGAAAEWVPPGGRDGGARIWARYRRRSLLLNLNYPVHGMWETRSGEGGTGGRKSKESKEKEEREGSAERSQ